MKSLTYCWLKSAALFACTYFSISLPAAPLIDCPDCKKPVSSRAVHCPNCGCPGYAISQETLRIAEAQRPKSILHIKTPTREGIGVAVKMGDTRFVVFDAELLCVLDSLEIFLFDRSEELDYQGLELAVEEPLARFKISSEKVEFISNLEGKGDMGIGSVSKYLLSNAKFGVNDPTNAVAQLDLKGRLVSILTKSKGFAPFNNSVKWIQAPPADYRAQAKYLEEVRLGNISLEEHRDNLTKTKWLTGYLKSKAESLMNNSKEKTHEN
jgi:hypothetical protein